MRTLYLSRYKQAALSVMHHLPLRHIAAIKRCLTLDEALQKFGTSR